MLVKPVLPEKLTAVVRQTLQRSAELRARAQRLRARIPELRTRSQRALDRSQRLMEASAVVKRCPKCAAELRPADTRTLHGVTFDYFHPCPRGCGLFCYDRGDRRMISIIE